VQVQLVDTHCHLDLPPLAERLEEVLPRAQAARVQHIVTPATGQDSWATVTALGRRRGVHPALGLHPWWSAEALDLARLASCLEQAGAVAVGEIGLDFAVDDVDRPRQLEVLSMQLGLARDLDLPVLLHCRGAFDAMFDALDGFTPGLRGVVHAFSKGLELAERFSSLGLHVAFGGTLTRDGARRAQAAARSLPRDRLLLETDAPSIGMEGIVAAEVEPAHVRQVAERLAALRGETVELVAEYTTDNARRLFKLD
jgi:TatD DNase family protein